MKKPNWQPDKISLTLLVLLSFGAAIGCIMLISKNVRTIGAIVLPVCIAGIVATIVIGQKIFYKKIKKGSSVKQIKSPLQNKFDIWLDSVLKDFNMNAVAFNFNIYDNGDNNFSVELLQQKLLMIIMKIGLLMKFLQVEKTIVNFTFAQILGSKV